MRLTKQSELLLSYFIKNKCVEFITQNKKTDKIFLILYNEIKEANKYIESLKKRDDLFYRLQITEIHSSKQIAKPKTFPADWFPNQIRKHIDESIFTQLCYSFKLFGRKIQIYFLLEDIVDSNIDEYNKYVDNILIWLFILNEYASKNCADELTIYLYFTSLNKNIPSSNIHVLDHHNVNTAFTTTCPKKSEIVIYRKEEWFKVFLHETFHTFGLDFSDMNNEDCKNKILSIFPVNSEVNLYESYSEFWAKIMNCLFCSYHHLENKNNTEDFLNNCEFFINFERIFSYFQMIKVLDFMNLNYSQLYKKGPQNHIVRNTMYKEKTNVLSYYIVTLILLNDYPCFLEWCNKNNTSLLQFKKTISSQISFCNFIEDNYKNNLFIKNVKCMEKLLSHTQKKDNKEISYLLKNLRMSICEMESF
jgi:hypothetical protein